MPRWRTCHRAVAVQEFVRMKLPKFLASILTATAFAAHAEISPIHIAVELISKSDSKPAAKGQVSYDHTQTRSLKIKVENTSAQAFDGVVIKYWFLGHSMTEHGTKVIASGERKATLEPHGKDLVESEVVSKQYTEAHSNAAKGGKGGKPGATTKVPASGERILGYAVRAVKDGKVLTDYYSDTAYKAVVDASGGAATTPAAAPGAKPAKK